MKKHLNTLYVTTQGAYLSKEGETVLVSVEGEKRLQVPVHTLGGIVCFGRVMCSPFLMGFCAENNVGPQLPDRKRTIPGAGAGTGFRQRAAAPRAIPPGRCARVFGCHGKVLSGRQDRQRPDGPATRL